MCKRHPQQRDLLTRPNGRFHHLATGLAALGHEVHVALLSHRHLPSEAIVRSGVNWYADDLLFAGPVAYWRRIHALAKTQRMDWVVGCSDIYYGVLAVELARRCGARAAVDAYDNFESYMPWAKPPHWAWRRALARADLVTAAGPQLAELLGRSHAKRVHVLPMTADPQFVPAGREDCRRSLNLPQAAPLIGYCGSFTRTRGSDLLLEAFDRVRADRPDARLVLSGRHPTALAQRAGVISLGMLKDEQMPAMVNSLDLACVLMADTLFGRYSYPAKLCEAMACGVPVVASATAPVRWMLADDARFLAAVGNAGALAAKILGNLEQRPTGYSALPSWSELTRRYERLLMGTAPKSR